MKIKIAINKAIEGGYPENKSTKDQPFLSVILLDPDFWKALSKALGWQESRYQSCELVEEVYTNDLLGRKGIVIGESRQGDEWRVIWRGKKTVYNYPKKSIKVMSKSENWRMVWHRLVDHLAEGGDIVDYFKNL